MSSSVHYKFKSQKEPSRVTFDGTGISVFELKREIITRDKLGDGTDFELSVYNQDTNEEYDDDTTIVPRSTYVIARRLPAARPGRGGAARYVSGSMPARAKTAAKAGVAAKSAGAAAKTESLKADMSSAQTEEERMKAMFNLSADQWKQQQQEMANATPVYSGRPMKGKPTNVPEGEPPHGYLCYRCRKKGHWIQACPTNDDPNYDNRLRTKRPTGIPRSFQKTVTEPADLDSNSEDARRLMINADGEFVRVETDQKAWKQYQEKAKASAAAQEAAAAGSKELQDLGIECPIDMKMFVDPMKTPCCSKTYCNDCITNALIESDLVCPGCSTENVLIDNLTPDKEVQEKIKQHKATKAEKSQEVAAIESQETPADPKSPDIADKTRTKSRSNSPATAARETAGTSKKRPAEDDKPNGKSSQEEAPAMKKQRSQETNSPSKPSETPNPNSIPGLPPDFFSQNMPLNNFNPMAQPGFPSMGGFPGGMPFMSMPGNMPMMNPMMMPGPNFMGNGMNGMNGMGGMMNSMNFPNQPNGMFPGNFNNSMMNGGGFGVGEHQNNLKNNTNSNSFAGVPTGPAAMTRGGSQHNQFSNQQRNTTFTGKEEDNAYFRQPVNPHRHQARQRRARPSDYTEL